MRKTTALILAGGLGHRMGLEVPKQFLTLGGKAVIEHSIISFESSASISDIVIVAHKDHIARMKSLVSGMRVKKVRDILPGGETRQKSSFEGLKGCPQGTEHVLIHDAARPLLPKGMIEDLLRALETNTSAVPAVELSDTVVNVSGGVVTSIPSRDGFRRIQTPQAFRYGTVFKAHERALDNGVTSASDDSALVLALGEEVILIPGSEDNLKITRAADIELAELILLRQGKGQGSTR